MTPTMRFFIFLILLVVNSSAYSDGYSDHTDFDKYSVYYSIFNSTFVPPEVAEAVGLKRSAYESLINVSLSPAGDYGALPAESVTGFVTNLMQQQKRLEFVEIVEKDATYYIAPIRISGEELLHFELSVIPFKGADPLKSKFSRKVYSD